ncbi:MAG: Hsp33 family molecular chaperone HslO [Myxococcota bacterium]|nr:Hsp33 family molecular chaperone HslO [Myxococcota bacterium]
MSDLLIRAITSDGCYRLAAVSTTLCVKEIVRRHRASSVAAQALARAATATALLSTSEKEFHRIGVQWTGRGPLRSLHADVRPGGELRAYAGSPGVLVESVSTALGAGVITVIRQDQQGRFTQGSLPLSSSTVDEDLEQYLWRSEQLPSRLRVFIDQDEDGMPEAVCGVLVQTLPGGVADALLGDGGSLSSATFARALPGSLSPKDLLSAVLCTEGFEVLAEEEIVFACQCSRDRVERGVALLGPEELLDMIAKEEPAEVRCDFCAEQYRVDIEGLCRIYDEITEGK